jgi:hypothetical protein
MQRVASPQAIRKLSVDDFTIMKFDEEIEVYVGIVEV